MTRFVHKVIMNPEDGYGRSTGSREVRLGEFFTIEEARLAKVERDKDKDAKHCDCGDSWITFETISQQEIKGIIMNWKQEIQNYGERHNLTNEDVHFMISITEQVLAEKIQSQIEIEQYSLKKEIELLKKIYDKISEAQTIIKYELPEESSLE